MGADDSGRDSEFKLLESYAHAREFRGVYSLNFFQSWFSKSEGFLSHLVQYLKDVELLRGIRAPQECHVFIRRLITFINGLNAHLAEKSCGHLAPSIYLIMFYI